MVDDSDLLPCPHCGSAAKSYHRDDESGWSNTDWICCDAGDDGIYPECGAQTCLHESRGLAVAAWNRRAA
ncbi:Lar family restriction alleviation protein [Rhizobium ruizarguesonis]